MLRLQKHKSDKFGEGVHFKLSNFHALQVPKGLDKLFVSVLSEETGKRVHRTRKTSVKNGSCIWTDTFSESVCFTQDNYSNQSKECIFKLVLAMGSSRLGVLGEATINLASYISSESTSVSLPLKKCNHGVVLQVKIQCLTPRTVARIEQWKAEEVNGDYDDMGYKSDVTDSTITRSIGSSSSNHFDCTPQPNELFGKDVTCSASGSHYSCDTVESSFGKESYSPRSDVSSTTNNTIEGNGLTDFFSSSYRSSLKGSSRMARLSSNLKASVSGIHILNPRDDHDKLSSNVVSLPSQIDGYSEELQTSAIITDELRAESMAWEQNARRLMNDVEEMQKQLSHQAKHQETLEMALSASHEECVCLREEIKQLNIVLEESAVNASGPENLKIQTEEIHDIHEIKCELKFQIESNANLASQLQKTQESNIELVLILQELESTVEEQKKQISNLLNSQLKLEATQNCKYGYECYEEAKLSEQVLAKSKVFLASDTEDLTGGYNLRNLEINTVPNDSGNLELQLQKFSESQESLKSKSQLLEKLQDNKDYKIEIEKNHNMLLMDCEAEWTDQLSIEKEKEKLFDPKTHPFESPSSQVMVGVKVEKVDDCHLLKEIDALKQKVQELERDCNELTDENLDLLLKLKDSVSPKELKTCYCEIREITCHQLGTDPREKDYLVEHLKDKCANLELQLQAVKDKANSKFCEYNAMSEEQENKISMLQQELKNREETKCKNHIALASCDAMTFPEIFFELPEPIPLSISTLNNQYYPLYSSMDTECSYCLNNTENTEGNDLTTHKKHTEVTLNNTVRLQKAFEEDVRLCGEKLHHSDEYRARLDSVDESPGELEFPDAKDNTIETSDHIFERLQVEPEVTNCEMVIADEIDKLKYECINKVEEVSDCQMKNAAIVARKSQDEESNRQLEMHLTYLEEENLKLAERICGMEAHLRYLTDERESGRFELHNSKSFAKTLENKIKVLEIEIEERKMDMTQKIENVQRQWIEAKEENKHLLVESLILKGTAECFVEESSLLQKSNLKLRVQNIDLHGKCTVLEVEQQESEKIITHIHCEVESLEQKYTLLLEEFALKEKALSLELNVLIDENKIQKDKLALEESQLAQNYLEKTLEVENLEMEVAHLTGKIFKSHDERTASEAVLEVSQLRANYIMLEAAFQQVQDKLKVYESNHSSLQVEYERELFKLRSELSASKQNQQVIMGNHDKLLSLLEDVTSNDERNKRVIRGLVLRLKNSEFESLEQSEKISNLTVQLRKTASLSDEVLALKRSLIEVKYENEIKEVSLQILTGDYEELKAENIQFLEKISGMQKEVAELKDCRHSKIALEEKVLRLEGDLTALEALSAQDAEMKIELGRITITNSQLLRKTKSLEVEKDLYITRVHALEDELRINQEVKHHGSGTSSVRHREASNLTPVEDQGVCHSSFIGVDPFPKIRLLEDKLAEAMEANDMYKVQLQSFLSKGRNSSSDTIYEFRGDSRAANKDAYNSNKSSFETELNELRDRYFDISLKYAEAQAERDQLKLKLKSFNSNGRY